MITVEISLKRDDGTVLVSLKGDATQSINWNTLVQHQIKDGAGQGLIGFSYRPLLTDPAAPR